MTNLAICTEPDTCLCGSALPCEDHPEWNPQACVHCGSTAESVADAAAWMGIAGPAICCELAEGA